MGGARRGLEEVGMAKGGRKRFGNGKEPFDSN